MGGEESGRERVTERERELEIASSQTISIIWCLSEEYNKVLSVAKARSVICIDAAALCVYIYIYTHTHTHTHTHMCVYIYIYILIHLISYTCHMLEASCLLSFASLSFQHVKGQRALICHGRLLFKCSIHVERTLN